VLGTCYPSGIVGWIADALAAAFELISGGDPELLEIIVLSLRVSGTALLVSSAIGLPMGALLGVVRFPGRRGLVVLLNTLMGLPPVVVGLGVLLLLSRPGPLGHLGLLFTPEAMMIAQSILITPIVAALTRQTVEDLWGEYGEQLQSLGAGRLRSVATLLFEARFTLLTAVLAGFGRAIAEVGAVQIVGGNIAHVTRIMTTTIALDTNRGEFALAMGLGIVLLLLALTIVGSAELLRGAANRVA
jgi:tungstate transport system permease protein